QSAAWRNRAAPAASRPSEAAWNQAASKGGTASGGAPAGCDGVLMIRPGFTKAAWAAAIHTESPPDRTADRRARRARRSGILYWLHPGPGRERRAEAGPGYRHRYRYRPEPMQSNILTLLII